MFSNEELIVPAMSGIPENQRHYEPFVDLEVETDHKEENIQKYRRELALEKALCR